MEIIADWFKHKPVLQETKYVVNVYDWVTFNRSAFGVRYIETELWL